VRADARQSLLVSALVDECVCRYTQQNENSEAHSYATETAEIRWKHASNTCAVMEQSRYLMSYKYDIWTDTRSIPEIHKNIRRFFPERWSDHRQTVQNRPTGLRSVRPSFRLKRTFRRREKLGLDLFFTKASRPCNPRRFFTNRQLLKNPYYFSGIPPGRTIPFSYSTWGIFE